MKKKDGFMLIMISLCFCVILALGYLFLNTLEYGRLFKPSVENSK